MRNGTQTVDVNFSLPRQGLSLLKKCNVQTSVSKRSQGFWIEVFRCKVLRLWQFVRNNRLLADEICRYVTEIALPVSKCFSMSKTPPLNDKQLLVRKELSTGATAVAVSQTA